MKLLPPTITTPISECNRSIEVKGQLIGATVRLWLENVRAGHVGVAVATWSRQIIPLTPGLKLKAGSSVVAVQELGGEFSPTSVAVKVQKRPPTAGPLVIGGPVYRCGMCLMVHGALPGAEVSLVVAGTLRGKADAPTGTAHIGMAATGPKDELMAMQSPCGQVGTAISGGMPIAPPSLKPVGVDATECLSVIHLSGLVVGAQVKVERAVGTLSFCADVPKGYALLTSPLKAGEMITVTQAFPACELKSTPRTVTAKPLVLGLPLLSTACPASRQLSVQGLVPGARLQLQLDGQMVGECQVPDATSLNVWLPKLNAGQVLAVSQSLCGRSSAWAQQTITGAAVALKPMFANSPLQECGGAVHLSSLTGAWVRLESSVLGAPVAEGPVPSNGEMVVYPTPLLIKGDTVQIVVLGCDKQNAVSDPTVIKAATKLGSPALSKLFEGMTDIHISKLTPGAWVDVFVDSNWQAGRFVADDNDRIVIEEPLAHGQVVTARQRLCHQTSPDSWPSTVFPSPPLARFAAKPLVGNAPLTVAFENTSVGVIDEYKWDFGDGSGATSNLAYPPPYTYANPMVASPSLTVRYSKSGEQSMTALNIHVESPAPPNTLNLTLVVKAVQPGLNVTAITDAAFSVVGPGISLTLQAKSVTNKQWQAIQSFSKPVNGKFKVTCSVKFDASDPTFGMQKDLSLVSAFDKDWFGGSPNWIFCINYHGPTLGTAPVYSLDQCS